MLDPEMQKRMEFILAQQAENAAEVDKLRERQRASQEKFNRTIEKVDAVISRLDFVISLMAERKLKEEWKRES